MTGSEVDRRFRAAMERARREWAAADPAQCAARAGCELGGEGVVVPFLVAPHLVAHPGGEVTVGGGLAQAAVAVVLLHYLLHADGAPPAGEWVAFRELPDGLFYAPSYAHRAEEPLAEAFGTAGEGGCGGIDRFRAAAAAAGGQPLDLADASYAFQVLPRLRLAALLWAGDEEFPAQARVVFDGAAGHYLPAEDLAGLGGWLAQRLVSQA